MAKDIEYFYERNKIRLFGHDGTSVVFPHTKNYSQGVWAMGKCWSVFCRNPLHYVRLNKKGEATFGYCFCRRQEIENTINRKGYKWVYVERGKLKELKLLENTKK